jgi:hypothetical protein
MARGSGAVWNHVECDGAASVALGHMDVFVRHHDLFPKGGADGGPQDRQNLVVPHQAEEVQRRRFLMLGSLENLRDATKQLAPVSVKPLIYRKHPAKARPVSTGRAETSSRKASSPPADAPIPTMRTAAAVVVGEARHLDGAWVAISYPFDSRLRR